MRPSVYLACSQREIDRVVYYAERIERAGLTITCKWWEHVLQNGVGNDGALHVDEQKRHALGDLRGVREASIFWWLWSPTKTHADFEAGYAYGLHARGEGPLAFIASGPGCSSTVFSSLAFRDESDAIGLVEIVRRAGNIARGLL